MTITNDQIMVASALGYSNYEDLLRSGISVTCTLSWSKKYIVRIFHSDPFYASYSRASEVMVFSNTSLTSEEVKQIKKRIKAKETQGRKLERIRDNGINQIIDFIAASFRVPKELVEIKDISWRKYSVFIVAGVTFRYDGTISDESFNIHSYSHKTYEDAYADYKEIINFYMKKEPYLKNNHI